MAQRVPDNVVDYLTVDEKNACREIFDMFDKDCDGTLDERELKACLEGKEIYEI